MEVLIMSYNERVVTVEEKVSEIKGKLNNAFDREIVASFGWLREKKDSFIDGIKQFAEVFDTGDVKNSFDMLSELDELFGRGVKYERMVAVALWLNEIEWDLDTLEILWDKACEGNLLDRVLDWLGDDYYRLQNDMEFKEQCSLVEDTVRYMINA